jgi:RHS repeat-associated protein
MHEEESTLIYNRLRFQTPALGRSLSRDPLGYVDSTHLYQTNLSSPLNFVDWLGGPNEPTTQPNIRPTGRDIYRVLRLCIGSDASLTRTELDIYADTLVSDLQAKIEKCCQKFQLNCDVGIDDRRVATVFRPPPSGSYMPETSRNDWDTMRAYLRALRVGLSFGNESARGCVAVLITKASLPGLGIARHGFTIGDLPEDSLKGDWPPGVVITVQPVKEPLNPLILSHEMGHACKYDCGQSDGEKHSNDPKNLMYGGFGGAGQDPAAEPDRCWCEKVGRRAAKP